MKFLHLHKIKHCQIQDKEKNRGLCRALTGNGELFAAKTGDTFEDALLGTIDAIKVQIEKTRNK